MFFAVTGVPLAGVPFGETRCRKRQPFFARRRRRRAVGATVARALRRPFRGRFHVALAHQSRPASRQRWRPWTVRARSAAIAAGRARALALDAPTRNSLPLACTALTHARRHVRAWPPQRCSTLRCGRSRSSRAPCSAARRSSTSCLRRCATRASLWCRKRCLSRCWAASCGMLPRRCLAGACHSGLRAHVKRARAPRARARCERLRLSAELCGRAARTGAARRSAPPVLKLEVSEATVRKVVSQAVAAANDALALLYKLSTGQDPKLTGQARARSTCRAAARGPPCSSLRAVTTTANHNRKALAAVTRSARPHSRRPPHHQAFFALYTLSKIGSWFSFVTLAYIGAAPLLAVLS